MDNICATCKYWQAEPARPHYGWCCKDSPVNTKLSMTQGGPIPYASWPMTLETHEWCGDGQQRPPAP